MFDTLKAILGGRGSGPVPSVKASTPYESGSVGTRRTRGWEPPSYGPVAATLTAATIRARARDAARNDGLARAIVEQWTSDLNGWGYTPRSKAKNAALRDRLHDLWARWSEEAGSGGQDFAALTAAAMRSLVVDGEILARLRPRRLGDGLVVPLQVELLDPARLADLTESAPNGGQIIQGVEFSAIGQRVAYWILDYAPGEPMPAGASTTPTRVPASSVLHAFDTTRPGQVRGISFLATALPKLRALDLWADATLMRVQLSNMFSTFIRKPSLADAGMNVLSGLPADDMTADGRSVITLEPGTFQELGPGEEITHSEPPDPPADGSFGTMQQRLACNASGMPYEIATSDWGSQNDRIARVTLHSWRRKVEMLRWTVVIPGLLRPVWRAWVATSGITGSADDPGWNRAEWRSQSWPYTHPTQDVAATLAAVRGGLTSLSAAIAETTGEDAAEVLAQIAADQKLADSLGLSLESDARQGKATS